MDELKNENKFLRSQIGRLKALYLTAILAFVSGIISFQIQYIRIFSYYQSTVDTNQEILLNQKFSSLVFWLLIEPDIALGKG